MKEERKRYDLHENKIEDPAYREFLSPTAKAIRDRINPPAQGLDFGAGPGPALAAILRDSGYAVSLYDKFFHSDTKTLHATYDFIVCTETAEHFRQPRLELLRLWGILRPKGWLALRTELFTEEKDFPRWHYPRDPTHISIFSPQTMQWVGRWLHAKVEFPEANLALFQKPSTQRE